MKVKNLSIITISILTIFAFTSCEAFSFGNEGEFVKLRNIPKHERIFTYFSPTEIFYPGELHYKDNYSPNERILSTAKIYNIKTQKLTDLGVKMNMQRRWYDYINLSNGNILILGGYNAKDKKVKLAEIYNKKTGRFEIIGESNFKYSLNKASKINLNDGRLLLVEGQHMEIFDPKTNKFTLAGKCKTVNESCTLVPYSYSHSWAIKLNNGSVYIEGKVVDEKHNTVKKGFELYDADTNTLTLTKPIRGQIQLTDGRFYSYSNFIYDPVKDEEIQIKESEPRGKRGGQMFPLSDNRVLITGISYPTLASVLFDYNVPKYIEIYNPKNDTYKKLTKKILFPESISIGKNTFFILEQVNQSPKYQAYLYMYKAKK